MLSNISESDHERLRDVINRLLSINYLIKEQERDKYIFARRYRENLTAFFRFLDWDIVFDERHECIFVCSPQSIHRRSLSKDESIALLIFRLIYEEKRQSLSLTDYPMATLHEIRTKYETFRIPFLNRTKLQEIVRLFTQYKLIESIDQDIRQNESRFRLFHTLLYAVEASQLDKLQTKIMSYEADSEEGLFNEVDDTTSVS